MSKEFNITITPTDEPKQKEYGDKTCKGFTITIMNLIKLSGKIYQNPPKFEMSGIDIVSNANLGNINGKLEDTIFLNFNVPNAAEPFLEGRVNFYLREEKAVYLRYVLTGNREITGDVELFYFEG